MFFLGATKHLYNWLCPSVSRSVGWSVMHSFDDPHVTPYRPSWPCLVADSFWSVHWWVSQSVRHIGGFIAFLLSPLRPKCLNGPYIAVPLSRTGGRGGGVGDHFRRIGDIKGENCKNIRTEGPTDGPTKKWLKEKELEC